MNKKLRNIGASMMWFIGAITILSQLYRIVTYYIFNIDWDWAWVDLIISLVAFAFMFIKAKLKSIVASALQNLANRAGSKRSSTSNTINNNFPNNSTFGQDEED